MAYKRSNVSKKSNRKNSRRSSKRVQRGGDGQGREYAYGFPIQYFGGKLNRYFPFGNLPELLKYLTNVSSFSLFEIGNEVNLIVLFVKKSKLSSKLNDPS